MSLDGKHVVIVGGTSGMGLATARRAAALGADVVAAGRRRIEEREPLDGVTPARVDTTDETSVRALFDEVGDVDHVFVSSSPGSPGPLLEQDLATARTFVDGKLLGSWMCARYAAPRMRTGGSITFVTGCAVLRPPRHAAMVVRRVCRGRGTVARARARAGAAAGQHDPARLHRQRDVVGAGAGRS